VSCPTFNGQMILGTAANFTVDCIITGSLGIDNFLGLTPGTTEYDPTYRAFGVSGAWVADDPVTPTTDAATCAASALITGPFVDHNGNSHENCSFQPTELQPSAAGVQGSGPYSLNYLLVIRQESEST
jgi:hypothetical protein